MSEADNEVEDLAVDVVREADAVVVVVSGDVDLLTGNQLLDALISEVDRHEGRLIVDLDAVRLLSSSGLSALARADRAARERGVDLRVVAPSRITLRPLQITGMTEQLAVYASRADAMAEVAGTVPSRRIG
jgi:anti-sigma B factor antagonist